MLRSFFLLLCEAKVFVIVYVDPRLCFLLLTGCWDQKFFWSNIFVVNVLFAIKFPNNTEGSKNELKIHFATLLEFALFQILNYINSLYTIEPKGVSSIRQL